MYFEESTYARFRDAGTDFRQATPIVNSKVFTNDYYTQYGPIKNGRIKNQGSDFEKQA